MKKPFTLRAEEELIKKLKIAAVESDKNANEIVEEALKLWFESQNK